MSPASVGRCVPSSSSANRPPAARELAAYGGRRLLRGKRVLDLGTGDGRLALGAAELGAREVVGIDPDPAALRDARAKVRTAGLTNVLFRLGSAQELPVAAEKFDLAILSWVL